MDNDKATPEHKPWDDLEFGANASNTIDLPLRKQPGSTHIELTTNGETFWDSVKVEGDSITTNPRDNSVSENQDVMADDQRWSANGLDLPRINSRALAAAQTEHRMSFLEGLRTFPRAIFWAAVISLAIVGEGFDTGLINSFFAFEMFQKAYGTPAGDGTYQITTKWQASLNNGSVAGAIVGLLANGWLSERFGYRRTLMGAIIALALFIFLAFFGSNIEMLLAAQILCGVPWGICSTLAISYAAEVMPLALRGHVSANINLCWIIGQIITIGTLRGFIHDNSRWSYRIPFSLQWVWAAIVLTGAYFAPESPWWLVRKRRFNEAREVLLRLGNESPTFNPDNVIAMMRHTDEVEKQLNNGSAERNDLSYLECFRGTNLRRTEIACMIFMTQNLCGLPLIALAAYFYNEIGFDELRSFDLTLGMHGLALIACLIALVLIRRFGRRQIYLFGLVALFIILLSAATVATLKQTKTTLWIQAAMVMLFIFTFDLTVGPLTYTLVAEIPSTRLRVNTVALARISYNICSLITNIIGSHALNPLSWNLQGKANWIWCGSCAFCLAYCYWRLPEPKGLTFHELDVLFEKKAPARKFSSIQRRLEETGYFGFYEGSRASEASVVWR